MFGPGPKADFLLTQLFCLWLPSLPASLPPLEFVEILESVPAHSYHYQERLGKPTCLEILLAPGRSWDSSLILEIEHFCKRRDELLRKV